MSRPGKGLVQCAIRSGQIRKIHACEVREGELLKFDPIKNEFQFSYIADDEKRQQAPVIGYYAFFETIGGYVQELYWTREKMEAFAKTYSQGYKYDLAKGDSSSFWSKDFDEMAKKTLLKQILKFAPMSVDSPIAKAIEADSDSSVQTEEPIEAEIVAESGESAPVADGNGEVDLSSALAD